MEVVSKDWDMSELLRICLLRGAFVGGSMLEGCTVLETQSLQKHSYSHPTFLINLTERFRFDSDLISTMVF